MDYTGLSYLLLFGSIAIAVIAQLFVSSSYGKYKRIKNKKGVTGAEVAREILDRHGLSSVYVTETVGQLNDHYDPRRKVVRLSSDIYNGDSIAAVSVAAHEVGHAIQDKEGYSYMKFRSAIFPLVNIASKAGYFAIIIGFVFEMMNLVWLGIACEVIILVFQLLTLPVEFDASSRAKEEIEVGKYLDKKELSGSSSMLRAAAFTYVASVVTALLQIVRLVIVARGEDRR